VVENFLYILNQPAVLIQGIHRVKNKEKYSLENLKVFLNIFIMIFIEWGGLGCGMLV
jgi:hypothetical protein